MDKFKKVLKLCRYTLLSIILLIFAVARIPFGGDRDNDNTLSDKDDLDSLLLKVYADDTVGGDGDDDGGDC